MLAVTASCRSWPVRLLAGLPIGRTPPERSPRDWSYPSTAHLSYPGLTDPPTTINPTWRLTGNWFRTLRRSGPAPVRTSSSPASTSPCNANPAVDRWERRAKGSGSCLAAPAAQLPCRWPNSTFANNAHAESSARDELNSAEAGAFPWTNEDRPRAGRPDPGRTSEVPTMATV